MSKVEHIKFWDFKKYKNCPCPIRMSTILLFLQLRKLLEKLENRNLLIRYNLLPESNTYQDRPNTTFL